MAAYIPGGILLIGLVLFGGSSRADSFAQLPLRALCIGVIAWLLATNSTQTPKTGLRTHWLFLAACVFVVAAQLVPFPPQVWDLTPASHVYSEARTLADATQQWHPISVTPDLTWNTLFAFIPALAVLLLVQSGRSRVEAIAPSALLIVACLSALLGFLQILGGQDSPLRFYRPTNLDAAVGLFANRNHNAVLLAIAPPLLGAWAANVVAKDEARARLGIAIAGSLFFVLAAAATGSRSGLTVAVLGTVAATPFWFSLIRSGAISGRVRVGRGGRTVNLGAVVAVAAVATVVVAGLFISQTEAVRRLSAGTLSEDLRVQITPVLLRLASEFFPLGSGFGSFDPVYRTFEPFELLDRRYLNQAHNDWLQVVIEGGLPGALLIVAFVVWFIQAAVRAWRSGQRLAMLGSIIVMQLLIASVTDYPLRVPLLAAIFTLAACFMATRTGSGTADDTRSPRQHRQP